MSYFISSPISLKASLDINHVKEWKCCSLPDAGESADAELSNTELIVLEFLDRENQHKNGKNRHN